MSMETERDGGGITTRTADGSGRLSPRAGARSPGEGLATFLGWFSVGLGVAQLVAPRRVARLAGMEGSARTDLVMRAAGLREIGHGAGILSEPKPAGWVWTRVAGDVMDLGMLAAAAAMAERKDRTALAAAAVLGVTVLDVLAAQELTLARKGRLVEGEEEREIRVRKTVTVGRPVAEVYGYWRDFENLPRFMRRLSSVTELGGGRSRWVAEGADGAVEWEVERVEDRENERIAWRSVGGEGHSGRVLFRPAPGDRGTEVTVELEYAPRGGMLGSAVATLLRREPAQRLAEELRAFKQVLETGEVVLSDATAARGPHPGSPPEGRDADR